MSAIHDVRCWSCGQTLTLKERKENDGHCLYCDAEIELAEDQADEQVVEQEQTQ